MPGGVGGVTGAIPSPPPDSPPLYGCSFRRLPVTGEPPLFSPDIFSAFLSMMRLTTCPSAPASRVASTTRPDALGTMVDFDASPLLLILSSISFSAKVITLSDVPLSRWLPPSGMPCQANQVTQLAIAVRMNPVLRLKIAAVYPNPPPANIPNNCMSGFQAAHIDHPATAQTTAATGAILNFVPSLRSSLISMLIR